MGAPPDIRVRLTAEGELSIINAFKRIQAQANQTGQIGARGLSALTNAASTLGRLLPGLSFVGIIAGATALAKKALESADQFAKLSQRTGVSVEVLSAYSHGADLAGIDTDALAKALGKLSKIMNAAAEGGDEAKRPFRDLGIEFRNQQGSLRPLDDVLGDLAEKFSTMPDGARKAALAIQFFGREGSRLIPFLNLGKTGLAEMKAEAERLGLVFDTKTALAAEAFNDSLKILRGTLQGFANEGMAALLPGLSEFIVKLRLINLELEEWKLRLESAAFASKGALEALIPFHGDKARGFFAMATDAANEAASVQIKWNAELSQGLANLAKLGQQSKRTPGTEPPIIDETARGKALDAARKLADARLALTRGELDAELALVKANIAASSAEESDRFKAGLTALEVYFGDRRAMMEFEAKKEIAILEQEAEAIRKRIDVAQKQPLKKGEPKDVREAEVVKLQTDLVKVETEAEVRRINLTAERAKINTEEREEVRKFNTEELTAQAQILTAQNQRFEASRAELEVQISQVKRLAGETEESFAERQRILREAGLAQIRFEEVQAQARTGLSELESDRIQIEALVTRGVITEREGQIAIAQLEKDRLPVLRQIAAAMKAAAVTPEQIETARQFNDQLEQLAASSDLAGQRMAEFKNAVDQALTSDLANFFSRGIDEATSFGDAMRRLAASVIQSLREIASQMLANLAIQALMGAIGGAVGGSLGTITTGSGGAVTSGGLIGAAGGGLVRGPGSGTSDSIPARLSDREFVVRAAVVEQPGVLRLLNILNEGGMEQFRKDIESFHTMRIRPIRSRNYARGGLVVDGEPGAGTRSLAGMRAEVGLDEVLFLKRLELSNEFDRAIVRAVGRNRRGVRALLR